MSAVHAAQIETAETPFARAQSAGGKGRRILSSDEMIRQPHSDLLLSKRFAALHRELGATYAARVKEAA